MQQLRSIVQHDRPPSGVEEGKDGQARIPTAADADDIDVLGLLQNASGFFERRSPIAQSVVQRFQKLSGLVQNILVEPGHLPSFTVSIVLRLTKFLNCSIYRNPRVMRV